MGLSHSPLCLHGPSCLVQVGTIAWLEAGDICGSHSIMIPCILAYPYVCRFFQCIRQYSDTKERPCIFNGTILLSEVGRQGGRPEEDR